MSKDKLIIKCPKCGKEYHISEIFYPDDIIPSVKNIVKDEEGKVIYYEGDEQVLTEEFVCDCGHKFTVVATVSFEVKDTAEVEVEFDDEYSTPIYTAERTELKED